MTHKMPAKLFCFHFIRVSDFNDTYKFVVHVATDGFESQVHKAWLLAIERANRMGPHDTKSLTLRSCEEVAIAAARCSE